MKTALPTLNAKTARRIARHAEKCGITPEFVVNHVLNNWLNETGDHLAARIAAKRKLEACVPA